MKIGITQRVDLNKEYKERRDCLDQNWSKFVENMGAFPVALSNSILNVDEYLNSLSLDGIIISGGNATRERDTFEDKLLKYAVKNKTPVVGVCRGMQVINVFFGGKVKKIDKHVGNRHNVRIISELYGFELGENEVNSYHEQGITFLDLSPEMIKIAICEDETIEAICHKSLPIVGIMWHPEREKKFDTKLFMEVFGI